MTSSFWLVLKDKSVHILDMNVYYAELTNFFTDVTQNLGDFMSGTIRPFRDKTKVKSDVTESLLQPSEFGATVKTPQPIYGEEKIDKEIIATVRDIAECTIDKYRENPRLFRVPLQRHIANNPKIATDAHVWPVQQCCDCCSLTGQTG